MDKSTTLARVPLFAGLSPSNRAALAERLRERAFSKGAPVFAQGDSGTSMFVILSGSVRVFVPMTDSPSVVVAELRAGEYFGEMALFDDQPRSASVEATSDTQLGELTQDQLLEYLRHAPEALVALLGEMSGRLRKTNSMLSERMAKNVHKEVEAQMTFGQRLSDMVAGLNGSWAFIGFLLLLSFSWMGLNANPKTTFDAYPYSFYNLFLAILVALQGPLIVMSQNRESMKDRMQSEIDFKVNLKNEMGIEQLVRDVASLRTEMNVRIDLLENADATSRASVASSPPVPSPP